MATNAVSGKDRDLLKVMGGGELLIIIISVGTVVLFFVLWTKRHVLRMLLISKKGSLTGIGTDCGKALKREIEQTFNSIRSMNMEPRILYDQGQPETAFTSFTERRDESTYNYRRRAYDLMSCLDDLLCRVDICLAWKSGQPLREHLKNLEGPPYAPFEGEETLCGRVADMYEHARYGARDFTESDYHRMAYDVGELTQRVHSKLLVPGSLVVPAVHLKTQQQRISCSSDDFFSQMKDTSAPKRI